MDEGLDKDDGYRMVEDEFQDIAKQFTRHLHAAEYQRLKKAARSQNAAVINSISRPISIQMPDETRRKVTGILRTKKQAIAVKGLLGKENHASGTDANSDDNDGAWLGTALHSLMESPRKSAASLEEISKSTRATVVYNKSRSRKSFSDLPRTEDRCQSTEGDDDADDLDAPVRSRSHPPSKGLTPFTTRSGRHERNLETRLMPSRITKSSLDASPSVANDENMNETSASVSAIARERISKRLEQSKIRQAHEEQEARKKLEIIPMFLP